MAQAGNISSSGHHSPLAHAAWAIGLWSSCADGVAGRRRQAGGVVQYASEQNMDVADLEVADADSPEVPLASARATGVLVASGGGGAGVLGGRAEIADPRVQAAAEADVVEIGSDSTDGSSDSDSSSRSRSRQRSKRVGAAAATALMTSVQPLDIDEVERVVERLLVLPTGFAAPLQHRGGVVAIMVETGAQVCVAPREEDPNESVVSISGSAHAVGRAVSSIELAHARHKEAEAAAPTAQVLAQLEIPAHHLNSVVGPSGEGIAEVRRKCAGIMIAVQPSEQPGGPVTAFIGPSDKEQVARAKHELRERLLLAEAL
uniref:K Homology domain-containing protein n=1 Tax=Alexandrium monilatum TaxID=311494 RepID=A0A6T0TN26_9DINO